MKQTTLLFWIAIAIAILLSFIFGIFINMIDSAFD